MDKHLFIEIILSEDAQFLGYVTVDGHVVEYYTGPSGRKVLIYLDDEFITKDNAKFLLNQLGMNQLIERLGTLI
jgi:hypothetical protein